MTAISTMTQSEAGLVALGATVLNLDTPTPHPCASYDYTTFMAAVAAASLAYPYVLTLFDLQEQEKAFTTQSMMGGNPKIAFDIYQYLAHYESAGSPDWSLQKTNVIAMLDHYHTALSAFVINGGWAAIGHYVEITKRVLIAEISIPKGPTINATMFTYSITLNL